jgi:UDP-N-acetyl-D-mannosaminuronic acid dehydrogenase
MTSGKHVDRTICVIGLGYVGLPTAALLARSGYDVLGVDIDEQVVADVNRGTTSLQEEGLRTILADAVSSGRLRAAATPEAADIFIICVPTPITADHRADLSAVTSAAEAMAPCVETGSLVILESTSPAGTTRNVIGAALEAHGHDVQTGVHVCYCPERVLPGDTVGELVRNSRIIGGVTPEAAERAAGMYKSFCSGEMCRTTDRVAELCKLMENTYRDVNIAIANVFARIGEEAGVDAHEAIRLANMHPRVDILSPGPGVGGHCIPVDPWFLIEGFPACTDLLAEARAINDTQAVRLLDRLQAASGLNKGHHVAILGLAYKGDIDDPRDSPTLALIRECTRRGLTAHVHDPLVETDGIAGVPVTRNLKLAVNGADAVIIMTDHACYRSLTPDDVPMRGQWIADGRGVLNDTAFLAAGMQVLSLGVAAQGGTETVRVEIPSAPQVTNQFVGVS